MAKKNILRIIALPLFLAAFLPAVSKTGINEKFFKKAAEKVWTNDAAGVFNPSTPIPDSIAQGQSAVIIARMDYFETKRDEQNSYYTVSARTNRTLVNHSRRSMVKVLDQSAVDYYTEFEFGSKSERKEYGFLIDTQVENAFGARVHKADGTVVDIDPKTALEISDGKKADKTKSYKIVIPSLEVGDVIEYFYYTEYLHERGDVSGLDMSLSDRYPILNRIISGKFDPELTAEFYSYNGAPRVSCTQSGEFYTANMQCGNIAAVSFSKFLYPEQQLPFVRLNVLNNYQMPGESRFFASTSRRGGLYSNVTSAQIIIEAKDNIARVAHLLWKSTKPLSPLPTRAVKMTRDYIKDHPGATPRQIADAAYLAIRYCNYTADDEDRIFSQFLLAMFYNDVLERLGIYPLDQTGIGIVNPRSEVPVDQLSGWDQTNFVACAGDSTYMMYPGFNIAPGEYPAEFQGSGGKSFLGRMREPEKQRPVEDFTVPANKYSRNFVNVELTVSLADDGSSVLNVERNVTLGGGGKQYGDDLVDRTEWLRGVEGYLGIDKPFRVKDYDAGERENELRDAHMDESEIVTGARPDSIMDFSITERGFLPGRDRMKYRTTARYSGLVEDLGGDLSVTLGRLAGHVARLEGSERERLLDAMLPTSYQNTHLITFKVPQGYKVDKTSLAEFNRQTANSLGAFAVIASEDENGDISISCVLRMKYATIPLQSWPLMRDLYDAAAQFADAAIIFTKQ